MEIKLNNGKKEVMLRGNDGTFEFCELRNLKKDGKPVKEWVPYAWYCSLSAALSRFAEVKLSNSDALSIEELQAAVSQVQKEIVDIYGMGV